MEVTSVTTGHALAADGERLFARIFWTWQLDRPDVHLVRLRGRDDRVGVNQLEGWIESMVDPVPVILPMGITVWTPRQELMSHADAVLHVLKSQPNWPLYPNPFAPKEN